MPPRRGAWRRRAAGWSLAVLICLVMLLLAAYASLPWLVAHQAGRLAPQLGLQSLTVEIGYPGLSGVSVHALSAASERLTVDARDATLGYDWQELLQGRLDDVVVGSARVTLRDVDTQRPASEPQDAAELFDALPFRRLRVDRLALAIVRVGFEGEGSLDYQDDSLALQLRGLAPADASRYRIDLGFSADGQYQATLSDEADSADSRPLRVFGVLGAKDLSVSGEAHLGGYALQLVAALLGVPAGTGNVDFGFATVLPWPLPDNLTWRDIVVAVPQLRIDWVAASGDASAVALRGSLVLDHGNVDAAVDGSAGFPLGESQLQFALPNACRLQMRDGVLDACPGLALTARKPGSDINAVLRSARVVDAATTKLTFDADIRARMGDTAIDGRLEARLAIEGGADTVATGSVRYDGGVSADDWSRRLSLQSRLDLAGDALRLDGSLSSGIIDAAVVTANYNLASGEGQLRVTDTLRVTQPLAAALLPRWPADYDLTAGRIELAADLSWEDIDAIRTTANLVVSNGDAHYGDYTATGLSGRLRLTTASLTDAASWRLEPAALLLRRVDVGVALSDVSFLLAWDGRNAIVRDSRAALLGGTVSLGPFEYDPDVGIAAFDATLDNIDLAEVLALEGDDIVGSGRIDGSLPVTIENGDVRVAGGKLRAQPPGGVIRIKSVLSGPTGQPGLDFALLALKDYRYTQLSADVDYAANGDLQLGVSLLGRNPAVENGRPIQYNLNVRENVPTLLESLRLKDAVNASVEKRVRQ